MKILAVTSVGGACGIANYAEMALEAVRAADPTIQTQCSAEALDPFTDLHLHGRPDVLWLNYHRGLHSRWTPRVLQTWMAEKGIPVVITFHDTYGESEPDDLARQLHDLADAFIVHEPCVGLPKQILIRQGVPAPVTPAYLTRADGRPVGTAGGPVLGTCGFNFPWKNFDRLAEVTAEAGWGLVILSNNATHEDVARWTAVNPDIAVRVGFLPTATMVQYLTGCDATAFPYECANSGTSGAIRLGIAARKPVIAFEGCRQFRDIISHRAIWEAQNWGTFPALLQEIPIQRVDPAVVALATRDSWATQGRRYAEVFRAVCR